MPANEIQILGCAEFSQLASILAAQDEDEDLLMSEVFDRYVFSNASPRRRRLVASVGGGRPFVFHVFDPQVEIHGLYPYLAFGHGQSTFAPIPLVEHLENRHRRGVLIDEDWIIAQLGIVTDHLRKVAENFVPTDELWSLLWRDCLIFEEFGAEALFRDNDLVLDWVITTRWFQWEKKRDPWGQRCLDLQEGGHGSIAIRTLQRHANALNLRYLAPRTPANPQA